MQCMEECKAVTNCTAVVYKRRFQICELYSVVGRNVTETSTSGHCTLMELSDGNRQKKTECSNGIQEPIHQEKYCGKTFCPTLNLPNGSLFGNMNEVGSRVKYTCNKYFKEASGNTESMCQQNDTWTHIPECLAYFQYMGCYEDNYTRIINLDRTRSSSMTTEFCLNWCFDKSYTYALTEAANECFCGNEPGFLVKRSEQECNRACRGDSSEFCGGHWRGSLYKKV